MAKSSTIFGQTREFSVSAPAINSGSNIPTVQFSTGNAKALADFSRTLFGLSSQLENQLDDQAEAEAAKEGAIAGLAGETEERTYETIRGRAYNKALLETFVTTMDTKASLAVAELQQKYYNDPVNLQRALNERLGGMSAELDKVAPGAGAAFFGRNVARSQPAVEAARSNRFNLTRSEAEASLITHEATVTAQISANAVKLFSDNPAESAASSSAIAQAVGEYMRIYDAVDPVTNRPLYGPDERAKAEVFMREKIASEAAWGWFNAQPDKAAAYVEMNKPDFQFKMNIQGQKPAKVMYANKGKIRSLPVTKDVMSKLEIAGGATGPNVAVHIISGGQVGLGEKGPRTGSIRHDHGNAADVVLSVNGKIVSPQQDPALYERFLENAAAAGFAGVGHYPGHVHVGGGSEYTWGPDGHSGTLSANYASAVERGRARRKSGPLQLEKDSQTARPLREVLGERSFSALDARLRQALQWENTQEEKRIRAEEKALKDAQDRESVDVTARVFSPGSIDPATGEETKPITVPEVRQLVFENRLTPTQANAFIKAIEVERPRRSDEATLKSLRNDVWNGIDVQDQILAAAGQGLLVDGDTMQLLTQNRAQNITGEGTLSKAELDGKDELEKLLTPVAIPGMNVLTFEQKQRRAFDAKQEYIRRVAERPETRETIQQIITDIADRAFIGGLRDTRNDISNLVLPRFYVPSADMPKARRIDPDASRDALIDAFDAGKISEREMFEQEKLINRWQQLQSIEVTDADKAQSNSGKGK